MIIICEYKEMIFKVDIIQAQYLITGSICNKLKLFSLKRSVYEDLVSKGVIEPAQEVPPPTVPMDYSWARVGLLLIV